MSNIVTQTPVKHPGIWRGEELFQRHDWEIELIQDTRTDYTQKHISLEAE